MPSNEMITASRIYQPETILALQKATQVETFLLTSSQGQTALGFCPAVVRVVGPRYGKSLVTALRKILFNFRAYHGHTFYARKEALVLGFRLEKQGTVVSSVINLNTSTLRVTAHNAQGEMIDESHTRCNWVLEDFIFLAKRIFPDDEAVKAL